MGWSLFKKRSESVTDQIAKSLEFSRKLQTVTNRIHATTNLDQIMLEMSGNICDMFNCDRLTLFAVSNDKKFIYSKLKTGIESDKDLVLPINSSSIAGWVAQTGRTVRISNVYDKAELKQYDEDMQFSHAVDQITGYHTKQMIAAPIFREHSDELLGVIQLLNNRANDSFTDADEEGVTELSETMAIAYAQRMKPALVVTSKYDSLIVDTILSRDEFELATRSARRQNIDIEDVLIDEFEVPLAAVGQALAKSFNLRYESAGTIKKGSTQSDKKIDRRFVEENFCLPIEDDGKSLILLTTDPERVIRVGAVKRLFPYANLYYRVTTKREFKQAVDIFYPRP
jgi:GAF domain-containing protein